jgi:hypothetical protein
LFPSIWTLPQFLGISWLSLIDNSVAYFAIIVECNVLYCLGYGKPLILG